MSHSSRTFSEIAEQVTAIHHQAEALVGQTRTLLRKLTPYIEAEVASEDEEMPKPRRGRYLGDTDNNPGANE